MNEPRDRAKVETTVPVAGVKAEDVLLDLLWRERYAPDGEHAECPKCERTRTFKRYETTQQRQSWTCTACGHHVHPTAGTIFHKSAVPLADWFFVLDVAATTPRVKAKLVEREIDVNYKTARRMVRLATEYVANASPWCRTYCACGCGEMLSPTVLQMFALARRGLTPWRIGLIVGQAPSYVRRTLRCAPTTNRGHWCRTEEGASFLLTRPPSSWNARQADEAAHRRAEIAAQRERKRAERAARWWRDRPETLLPRSLDSMIQETSRGQDSFYEITADLVAADPADILITDADSESLARIVGDLTPEDVARMTEWDLRRLRERLAAEGLAPKGVQESERARLRVPVRHSGADVPGAGHYSRRTRAEKIAHKAANRARGNSNRPAQKPPKRWAA